MAENVPSSSQLVEFWNASATSKEFRHPLPKRFIEKYFPAGASVLDIGCGQGRLTKYLSESGFSVSGMDISAAMLEQSLRLVWICLFKR
ncbi:MAG: class I SAM-dependent methyltransferase [Cyanobacteria bacterium J06554_11]